MTYTFATLDISQVAYDEIAAKLRAAGYDQAFLEDGQIDMHGIALCATAATRDINMSHFLTVPISEISTPKRGATVYIDMWWSITKDNQVLFYTGGRPGYRAPQCNSERRVMEHILPSMSVAFLPVAFVPSRESA